MAFPTQSGRSNSIMDESGGFTPFRSPLSRHKNPELLKQDSKIDLCFALTLCGVSNIVMASAVPVSR